MASDTPANRGHIFISYRRGDASAEAGKIYAALRKDRGPDKVFMDVSSIRGGEEWSKKIEDHLNGSSTVLAVIGPGWLHAANEWGQRRIDLEADWVRRELEAALKSGKQVIPVLVGDVKMPPEHALPAALQGLTRMQGLRVRKASFEDDMRRLSESFRRPMIAKGRLSEVVDLDGADLNVMLEGSEERLVLCPRLRIVAVTDPDRASAVLQDPSDAQLGQVRQRIHSLFSAALGLACDARKLNSVVTHTAAREVPFPDLVGNGAKLTLPQAISAGLGLEVHWRLELNQTATEWIRKLKAALPTLHTLEFNKESRTSQFRLTYSMRVAEVKLALWVAAQRRSHHTANMHDGVALEMQALHNLVFQVLNPAFGVFGGREKAWEHPIFWQAIRHAFEEVVKPRLETEFGYTMEFLDFKRELTEAERTTLQHLEKQGCLQMDFDAYRQSYKALLEKRGELMLAFAEIPESPEVEAMEKMVTLARQKLMDAQRELERASTGRGPPLSELTDKAWTGMITRFFGILGIKVPRELLNAKPEGRHSAAGAPRLLSFQRRFTRCTLHNCRRYGLVVPREGLVCQHAACPVLHVSSIFGS